MLYLIEYLFLFYLIRKDISLKTFFYFLFSIILAGCSGSSHTKPPQSRYIKQLHYYENICQEGLGTASSCMHVAQLLEKPFDGYYPDITKAVDFYMYTTYAAKKECLKSNGSSCLILSRFYKEGKGGLDKNDKLAHKYMDKACHIIPTDREEVCVDYLKKEKIRKENQYKAYKKKHPCELYGIDELRAKIICQNFNTKVMQGKLSLRYCMDTELRKMLRKKGCTKY